ncbi:MAG: hypothetical protein OEM15_14365 [Myxococcales bacterium]|nr:hypothetical protein [Myxococcales bacterium]MDH3483200.1 hypothetical protein [Myxococcales bacterium]
MTMSQLPDVNRELAEVGAMVAVLDALRRARAANGRDNRASVRTILTEGKRPYRRDLPTFGEWFLGSARRRRTECAPTPQTQDLRVTPAV